MKKIIDFYIKIQKTSIVAVAVAVAGGSGSGNDKNAQFTTFIIVFYFCTFIAQKNKSFAKII
jgi:hypothetical protein